MCLGIPGRIVTLTDTGVLTRSGIVDFEGVTREINLALVEAAGVGDFILAHAGIAISQINEREAQKVFEYLRSIDEAELETGDL